MNPSLIEQILQSGDESLLIDALQHIPAAVEIKNESMKNLFINRFGCELMGYQQTDIIGKNSLSFIPPSYHQEFKESTKQLFSDKKSKRITRLLDSDGSVHIIMSNINVSRVNGTEYSYHVWFDITDFPEIFDLARQKTELNESRKPISGKLLSMYRDMMFKYLVTDENFKDGHLSLLNMSVHLNIPQKYISHIINTELGIGFCDYVNYLRLRHFNEIKLHSENNIYTRESIAEKCGFSSHATFYRAQKKFQNQDLSFSL